MRSKEILKELGIKQSFLVKELIGNPISSFYGNNIDIREKEKQSDVIRVQLSSAINNNRIPSENLLENIKKVLLSKFKDKEDIEKIVSEFELSLKDTSKKIAYKKPKPVEQVVDELVELCKSPATQFIFSNEPAEMQDNETANELKDILIENLKLSDLNNDEELNFTYCFFIPDEKRCIRFWRLLKQSIKEYIGEDSSENEILIDKKIDQVNSKNLKVYLSLKKKYCWVPYVVFFRNNIEQDMAGYVFDYLPNGYQSIAELSKETLNNWYDNIHSEIDPINISDFKEIPFNNYLKLIKNEQ